MSRIAWNLCFLPERDDETVFEMGKIHGTFERRDLVLAGLGTCHVRRDLYGKIGRCSERVAHQEIDLLRRRCCIGSDHVRSCDPAAPHQLDIDSGFEPLPDILLAGMRYGICHVLIAA